MVKQRITLMSIVILSFVIVFSTQATALADIYGCVGKGGKLKIVGSPSDCNKKESPITFGGTPVNPVDGFEGELCWEVTNVSDSSSFKTKLQITNLGNGHYSVHGTNSESIDSIVGGAEYFDETTILMTLVVSGLSDRDGGEWQEAGGTIIRVELDPTNLNGTATNVGAWIRTSEPYNSDIAYGENTLAPIDCSSY